MPDKVVADADLIHGSAAENVDLLNGKYTVVDSQLCAESRQTGGYSEVGSCKCTEQGSVSEEEFRGDRITRAHLVVEVRIELLFVKSGKGSSRDQPIGRLWRRNQE